MNRLPSRRPVAVLISGRGSNMRSLVEYSRRADAGYSVVAVLSDQPAAAGLAAAATLGIPAHAVAPQPGEDRNAYDVRLAAAVGSTAPELLVLAGFMRILSPDFVARFAQRILNIHPSLLPAYPGLHTHRRVLAAGDAEHGATVHYVTAELDGGPRVLQARVPVLAGDDEASLAARVQVQEHRMYPLAVRWHCEGRLACAGDTAWFDGRPLAEPLPLGPGDAP